MWGYAKDFAYAYEPLALKHKKKHIRQFTVELPPNCCQNVDDHVRITKFSLDEMVSTHFNLNIPLKPQHFNQDDLSGLIRDPCFYADVVTLSAAWL